MPELQTGKGQLHHEVGKKIAKLSTHTRMLWSKYDVDLNTYLDGEKQIKIFMQHVFNEADLAKDYD